MANLFLCKHCNYSLNITKVSTSSSNLKIIKSIDEFNKIVKLENIEDTYDIQIDEESIKNYYNNLVTKKKLKAEERDKRISKFKSLKKNTNTSLKYNLECSTCGTIYPLQPGTVIYSFNSFSSKNNLLFDDESIDLKLYDPTLPRTKDYICNNKDCKSHDKSFDNTLKEAVFYRSHNSYHLKYGCLVCKSSWFV